VTLSTQPDLLFWAESWLALADSRGLQHGRDLFEDPLHAQVGVNDCVDFVMVSAGVHDQDFRPCVGFLHHIGQVMAIVLGQSSAENDQVERSLLESFLNALAILSCCHVMPGLFHCSRLGGESLFIRLAVKDLDRIFVNGLSSSRGHQGMGLLKLTQNSLGA